MAPKIQPPKLQVGDSWDDLTVIGYAGHYIPPTFTGSRAYHHYRVRCACGNEFVESQHRLGGKVRMKYCGPCGQKYRIERVKAFAQSNKPEEAPRQVMLHWPVPGR